MPGVERRQGNARIHTHKQNDTRMKKRLFWSFIAILVAWLCSQWSRKNREAARTLKGHDTIVPSLSDVERNPTLKIGAERLVVQFDSLLPQIHLTLVSVLQGLALGVLVEQIRYDAFEWNLIPLYVASLVLIAFIWHLYAVAFVTFSWPFWGIHTLLQFSLVAVEIFAFSSIAFPPIWVLAIGIMGVIGALIRWLNTKVVSVDNYERLEDYALDMQMEKSAARGLLSLGLVFISLGIILYILFIQQNLHLELIRPLAKVM